MNDLKSQNNIAVRLITDLDLSAVANIHVAAFPENAFTKFGRSTVRRYYHWILTGPHDVYPIGAFIDSQMIGFCFGGIFRGAVSGFLRTNRAHLFLRGLTRPWLIANPLLREKFRIAMKLLRRKRHKSPETMNVVVPAERIPSFGILSIAVHPEYQGWKAGKILMERSEDRARALGYKRMDLTVHTDNHQAIRFYETGGWIRILRHDQWSGEMEKHL